MNLISIMKGVSKYYGITPERIKGRERNSEVVRARFSFIYLAYQYEKYSLNVIGRFIGRDHSSILHALKQHNTYLDQQSRCFDQVLHEEINELQELIQHQPVLMYQKINIPYFPGSWPIFFVFLYMNIV